MKINEFVNGSMIEEVLLVKSFNQGVTTKGNPYLSIVLQDSSGDIDGKYWDVPSDLLNEIQPGNAYLVTGNVISYKNMNQLKIESMTFQPHVEASEFVRSSEYSKELLQTFIKQQIERIDDEVIKKVVIELLKIYHNDYFEYPAAMRNHHDFVRGLSEHVVTMLKSANALMEIYPFLNRSLVIGGIILHDLGKVLELSGPIATTYTLEGNLLGHISIIVGKIDVIAEKHKLQSESLLLLKHVILAHHGKLEYGSPVLPLIPEAEFIHYIDNIDARMNALKQAFEQIEEGNFTPRIFALENRSFYKAKK